VRELQSKSREVLFAVLPVVLVVLVFHLFIDPLPDELFWRFVIGAVVIVLGLTTFLIGIDIGITPVGELIGQRIAKSNRVWIVVVLGLLLGFLISVAEPDLLVLADQISAVTDASIAASSVILLVSIGVGVFVMLGLIRILFSIPLYLSLAIIYPVIAIFCLFMKPEMIAIAFDASGATTGALTVPFIMSLATGVAVLHRNSKSAEKDSFGLVALASAGAILGFLALAAIIDPQNLIGILPEASTEHGIFLPFWHELTRKAGDSFIALSPVLLLFLLGNLFFFKLRPRTFARIAKGFVFTYVGLTLFLVGVNAGFMEAGRTVGIALTDRSLFLTLLVSFLLGFFTVMAEPAVYILTHQIEDITSGSIRRRLVLFTLAIGVGIALVLNVIRILVPDLRLWTILLPGYLIALVLMFFTPKLFIAIGFDAGGVASGPITATFVLAFSQGIAFGGTAGGLGDVFGMIALIALTPIIAIEILGVLYRRQTHRKEVVSRAEFHE